MNIFKNQKPYDKTAVNSTMEECMEIIYSHYKKEGQIRANVLTFKFGAAPSSTSRIVSALKANELIEYEKHGIIKPTQKGIELGEYLLKRQEILNDFFSVINGTDEKTEEIKPISHYLSKQTIENIEIATEILKNSKE